MAPDIIITPVLLDEIKPYYMRLASSSSYHPATRVRTRPGTVVYCIPYIHGHAVQRTNIRS